MRHADDLRKLTVAGLRAIALSTGSPTTGNKQQVSTKMFEKLSQRPSSPVRLVSIDLGLKNIGVCQALATPKEKVCVEKWSLESLPEGMNYSQPDFAFGARQLVHKIMSDAPEVVLIERQRSRSGGSGQVPHDILRVNVLEGMMHAIMCTQWPAVYIESVDPKHLLAFWRVQWDKWNQSAGGHVKAVQNLKRATPAQVYAASKKARLALVRSWLDLPKKAPFTFAPDAKLPSRRGKQDDLNDALVQAVTWSTWRENSSMVLDEANDLHDLSEQWMVT